MIRIYKDNEVREVNNIDASAWIKSGWSLKPPDLKRTTRGAPTGGAPASSQSGDIVSGVTTQEAFMATPPPTQLEIYSTTLTDSEETASSSNLDLVNVNQARTEEIASLSGIGAKTASTLISNRPYAAIADLQKVLPKIDWESLQDKITF